MYQYCRLYVVGAWCDIGADTLDSGRNDSLIIVNVAGTLSWDVTEAMTAAGSIPIILSYCNCCWYIESTA